MGRLRVQRVTVYRDPTIKHHNEDRIIYIKQQQQHQSIFMRCWFSYEHPENLNLLENARPP